MITLFLNNFIKKLRGQIAFQDLIRRYREKRFPLTVFGPQGSFFALVVRELCKETAGPLVVVVPTESEGENLIQDLELFGVEAHLFPWWGSIPYKEVSSTAPVFGKRVNLLSSFPALKKGVVVLPLRSLLTPVPPADYIRRMRFVLKRKEKIDPLQCSARLQEFGYLRVPRVSVHGEFALRGEVLDIFLAGKTEACRVVFDFDTIGEIRSFDPESQTSTGNLDSIILYPMKELLWEDENIAVLEKRLSSFSEMKDSLSSFIEELIEQRTFPGEELFFPFAFEENSSLLDHFPSGTPVLFYEYERLLSAYDSLLKEYDGLFRRARIEKPVPRPDRFLFDFARLAENNQSVIRFTLLRTEDEKDAVDLRGDPPRSFFGNLQFFREEAANLIAAGYEIFLFADSDSQADRLSHILKDLRVTVIPESISSGFSFGPAKTVVIQENELFGRRKRIPKSVKSVQSKIIDTFVELSPGDYVVHVNYGIGRFIGIQRIKAAGNERDYIHLEYSDEEFIYIPIEQVNLIQRYIGSQGNTPRLDKIGGKSWENRKSRVRKAVEDIAQRLIELYSRRRTTQGFAFPKDTEWQVEFEAAFPYEETEDQLRCIQEVKADMEKPEPMDRLVCGDVGYGKTEIAIRASFKAILGGKQVAILAPTTILTEQHFENISERVRSYPIKTGMLSRFVSKADQKKVLSDLKQGKIDLVVGTHRLIQKDVVFRDLGLIIVDEEQRFGVKDKERLKELKNSVDCLTLTATPIPRTLHMSLLKIRDMSVLKTPPHNRLPIETHIGEYSEDTLVQAIRRETARGGQVYYLHNRVESLDEVKRTLEKLVPEILVGTAHGQMDPEDLEDIMHRFIHGGLHVLISTTIIENGIDIPNVNTIIIDRADMYGISQLYQLRGRVGRSGNLAYAYLFYPPDRVLTELAMKRLKIISDNTELGSGFKIALKDLEVRGAGNLLGREQSGDIVSVGFDMYLRLLDEAIRELGENKEELPPEVYMDLEYSGFIPDGYISEQEEKMEVYKKIASTGADEELEGITAELLDRFGPLPDEVQSLLSLAEIRILSKKLFVSTLREKKGSLEIEFSKVAKISVDRLLKLIHDSRGGVRLDPKRPHVLIMNTGSIGLKEKSEFIRDRLSVLL